MFLVRLSRAESVKKTQGVMRFSIRPKSKLWGVNSGYRRDPSSACMLDGLRGPHPTGRSVKVTGSPRVTRRMHASSEWRTTPATIAQFARDHHSSLDTDFELVFKN